MVKLQEAVYYRADFATFPKHCWGYAGLRGLVCYAPKRFVSFLTTNSWVIFFADFLQCAATLWCRCWWVKKYVIALTNTSKSLCICSPFERYHWGPALLLGSLMYRRAYTTTHDVFTLNGKWALLQKKQQKNTGSTLRPNVILAWLLLLSLSYEAK